MNTKIDASHISPYNLNRKFIFCSGSQKYWYNLNLRWFSINPKTYFKINLMISRSINLIRIKIVFYQKANICMALLYRVLCFLLVPLKLSFQNYI